jgi:hypothetical protein
MRAIPKSGEDSSTGINTSGVPSLVPELSLADKKALDGYPLGHAASCNGASKSLYLSSKQSEAGTVKHYQKTERFFQLCEASGTS